MRVKIETEIAVPKMNWRPATSPPPMRGNGKKHSDVVLGLMDDGNGRTVSIEPMYYQHEEELRRRPGWWFDGISNDNHDDDGRLSDGDVLMWAAHTYDHQGRES